MFADGGSFSRAIGLDLSARMLEQAARLGVYDQLIRTDALEFLLENSAFYDMILATDFFQYVADPLTLMKAASARIASGGMLCFTFDSHEGSPSIIPSEHNNLGFTYFLPAVIDWLSQSGCQVVALQPIIDRMSWSAAPSPIPGFALIAAKP